MKLHIFGFISVLAVTSLFIAGCPANNIPSSPSGPPLNTPTSTPTVTVNSNGPIIVADYSSYKVFGISGSLAVLVIADNLGTAVTTASVTLTTPGGNYALPYYTNAVFSAPASSGVTSFLGGEYLNTSVTYYPSQNCSFTVVNGGATYVSYFTTINPASSGVTGSTGVTFTWSNGGNYAAVTVSGNDNLQYGPPITSPYSIPAANFSGDPAGAGNDTVALELYNYVQPAFSGGQTYCTVESGRDLSVHY